MGKKKGTEPEAVEIGWQRSEVRQAEQKSIRGSQALKRGGGVDQLVRSTKMSLTRGHEFNWRVMSSPTERLQVYGVPVQHTAHLSVRLCVIILCEACSLVATINTPYTFLCKTTSLASTNSFLFSSIKTLVFYLFFFKELKLSFLFVWTAIFLTNIGPLCFFLCTGIQWVIRLFAHSRP